jgi:hypothetical protein
MRLVFDITSYVVPFLAMLAIVGALGDRLLARPDYAGHLRD